MEEQVDLIKKMELEKRILNDELSTIQSELRLIQEENLKHISEIKELKSQISFLRKEKKEVNTLLENAFKTIEATQKNNHDVIEKLNYIQSKVKLDEIKFEPNMYLKGKFIGFCHDGNYIKILIENTEYYYPLNSYECESLPMFDSRVLIFSDSTNNYRIYGFNYAHMIPEAKKIEAKIQSIRPQDRKIKLSTKDYGYIDIEADSELFDKEVFKVTQYILLKQIYIDGNYYFTFNNTLQSKYQPSKVLSILKELHEK